MSIVPRLENQAEHEQKRLEGQLERLQETHTNLLLEMYAFQQKEREDKEKQIKTSREKASKEINNLKNRLG